MILIFLYFIQFSGNTFTIAEQKQATAVVTQATEWWHIQRGTLFSIQAKGVIQSTDQTTIVPNDGTIVIYVLDSDLSIECGTIQALGCSTWHSIRLLNTDKPWIPTHELGHALYILPDVSDGIDIMNPWSARTAYEQNIIGCASLDALNTPCHHTYLPIIK